MLQKYFSDNRLCQNIHFERFKESHGLSIWPRSSHQMIEMTQKQIDRLQQNFQHMISYEEIFEQQDIPYIIYTNIKNFRIKFVKSPFTIISQICHIRFDQLIYLNLAGQNIQNVQDLQFVHAPFLRTIQLYKNNIIRINSLVKNTTFANLEKISFYDNPLSTINSINRGNFKKLTTYQPDGPQQTMSAQNINFIFKNSSQTLQSIYVQCSRRIISNKLLKMMKEMNEEATINVRKNIDDAYAIPQ